ncbi:DUF4157 domain-containing protein [Streptomyces sp. XD-27]|uniref:eCIS core domain-containing protein n=1 Tax=Streptomyces sp. XD-27 TaxID=3062779 RepID=UPI0026F42313|nr:DUF4157 domain-containing protein [Streptomyces sp. XD-27]WKX74571.1 DUF4157 domain-containing protein [Streptomyces sp. XD-27]
MPPDPSPEPSPDPFPTGRQRRTAPHAPPLPEPEGGTPLDGRLRAEMERAFAADFGDVRVHRGPYADELCALLDADACTRGSHVYLRGDGSWLLAHELAHVLQQRSLPRDMDAAALEREADRAADAVVRGDRVRIGPYPATAPAAPVAGLVVQAHSSWEHRLLGDLSPDQMRKIAFPDKEEDEELRSETLATTKSREDVLRMQEKLLNFAVGGAKGLTKDKMEPRDYPGLYALEIPSGKKDKETHQIAVSFGELTTLGDYFQNPTSLEALATRGRMVERVLQTVREESYRRLGMELKTYATKRFADSVMGFGWSSVLDREIQETKRLSDYTAKFQKVATDRYTALLQRNVCHFAPYSWYRWQQFHVHARDLAIKARAERDPEKRKTEECKTLLYAGYADHFLQDSFAAGHLVNKTLTMQWFLDWFPSSGLAPDSMMIQDFEKFGKIMTVEKQPGLAPTSSTPFRRTKRRHWSASRGGATRRRPRNKTPGRIGSRLPGSGSGFSR